MQLKLLKGICIFGFAEDTSDEAKTTALEDQSYEYLSHRKSGRWLWVGSFGLGLFDQEQLTNCSHKIISDAGAHGLPFSRDHNVAR